MPVPWEALIPVGAFSISHSITSTSPEFTMRRSGDRDVRSCRDPPECLPESPESREGERRSLVATLCGQGPPQIGRRSDQILLTTAAEIQHRLLGRNDDRSG
jgi:hypothetical protein